MRHPLLASGSLSASKKAGIKRTKTGSKTHMLAAGASLLALGIVNPAQVKAANVPGVGQDAGGTIAINLYAIEATDPPAESGATEDLVNLGGNALAEAIVSCAESATCAFPGAIVQFALGSQSASNSIIADGILSVGAQALAEGGAATAAGIIQNGIWQVAAASESARNGIEIGGLIDVAASAGAIASTGSAGAFAGIGAGISQIASSIGIEGIAGNSLENGGDLTISAGAGAEALVGDAAANAFVGVGVNQEANGQTAASGDILNSGSILVDANASATAENGIAAATASAAGLVQVASARTQQFASSFTSGGLLIGVTSDTPSGPAYVTLTNSGSIEVNVDAAALGGLDASATGAVLGIAQIATGSDAEAIIDNSGSIDIAASVNAQGAGTPRGVVFVSGISQAATAFAYATVETINPTGVLTYELSATPVGPAVASFENSGDITVAGDVNVAALGTTSMADGLGVAFVDGLDQSANGDGAVAHIDNSGNFTVSAGVTVDSGNVSNAVAIATGIDQYATAYASHVTAVFANGTTTPTTVTGGSTAIGNAAATMDNSGSLTVLANVESHGDQVAFAGATASAVGQFAAGTEASVNVINSGSILSIGTLSSSGHTAFGGVGAIGMQQGARGTALADAQFDNGGTFGVLAYAAASGEAGAFVNATAFGVAQNVGADNLANAGIANAGTIDIRAIGSAVAGDTSTLDMAIAFAAAHGLGQLAEGAAGQVEFDNSGTFQLLAEADASADDFALASAMASGVIQQVALGSASGTAAASIDNSGTILIGAFAEADAGSTAVAVAAVTNAIAQFVIAGEGGSASITNSGSIAMVANAEALAAGGDVTDVGSAQAYVFGITAAVSATGASGFGTVDLANAGTIDISAVAHATGSGLAQALATAAFGLVGAANVWFDGSAEVNLTNEGELTLIGAADATGGYTAHATGIALAGMDAYAAGAGQGDATAAIVNDGSVMLGADAHAEAGTNALAVAIAIDGLQATARAGIGDAIADIANSGELQMIANATASALNAQAFAIVGGTFFTGAVFQSAAAMNGNASALADNSGSISVVADAVANGEVIASASAIGGPGVNQFAFATSGDASVSFDNSGSLEFVANAEANATNSAYADAVFYNAVAQFANANGGAGQSLLQLTNEGSIDLTVIADASADNAAGALAVATHEIGQSALVIGNDAELDLVNSGSIDVGVAAMADGSAASASAILATAIHQSAAAIGEGSVDVMLENSGTIDLAVLASAESPIGPASAFAVLDGAVSQYGGAGSSQYVFGTTAGGLTSITQNIFPTGPVSLLAENSGSIDIDVAARAEGGSFAFAGGTGLAFSQLARGTDAVASLVNEGAIEIALEAVAEAQGGATATGHLAAFVQAARAMETTNQITATVGGGQVTDTTTNPVGSANVSLANSGSIEVTGGVAATAETGAAMASVAVEGVQQSVLALLAQASFSNGGEFLVGAGAEASADTGATAEAMAIGYSVSGTGFEVDFANTGDFTVIAQAVADGASGIASAHAVGLTATASADGFLNGSIENNGTLVVNAKAEVAGNASAYAQATGFAIGAGSSDLTISNSGLLSVSAATDGGTSQATAIRILDTGAASDPSAMITITNDGGLIIARRSEDGGESWLRGTAIDTSAAPNASVINLVGDGGIYGDISVAAGDTINVVGGETWFDGIINPACAGGGCGYGTLNVGDGGALFLRHDSAGGDGPSGAYVEQLNIEADGTLIFQLPSGGDPESAYPQIVADVANLDGTLLVRSATGLYADSYLFQDVINADTRNGQFDSCGIDGNPALLDLSCVYDDDGNVDLGIERIAFNAVAGLTRNQAAVGSGIEEVYDIGLTGPFAEMVEELFGFDEVEYADAVNQLTGAIHAAYLQSFNALGVQHNQLLDRATGCELPEKLVSSLSCRTGTIRLWGQVGYTNRSNDGDVEAPAYDAGQWTAVVGADVPVGNDAVVGASLAKVTNHLSFRRDGSSDADGYQVGLYGVFDPGAYYAKVFGTVGWYDGDSRRRIDWTPIGGTLAGQLKGDPDVRLATLGGHFGYRLPVGQTSVLTPFLNIDYISAKLDGFGEAGIDGAALEIGSSKSARTVVTIGAKWAADIGGIVPQAELGYRHLFGDRRATIDAGFAADKGSGFEIVSAAEKRGSLFGGLSLGGRAGPVDVRVGYQGLFDGHSTSHSGNFRIILPLGKD